MTTNNIENQTPKNNKTESTQEELKLKQEELKVVARKPFILNSVKPKKEKESELLVFTSAKKLSEYIFVITQNATKKYRWNIISRLIETSNDIVETLYWANFERGQARLELQKLASIKIRLLTHFGEVAYRIKALKFKHTRHITEHALFLRKLLGGWAKITMKKDQIDVEMDSALTVEPKKDFVRRRSRKKLVQLKLDL